jgi:hypothetical protein
MDFKIKNREILIGLTLSLTLGISGTAQASLTTNANGLGVYSSVSSATWTQDANVLGTLEGVYQSTSYNNIVTAIINASNGVIHDTPNVYDKVANSGNYTLTAADFGSGGSVTWWAGQAYVHYLDTVNYGGSSLWALPTTPDTNSSYGYNQTSSQIAQLYTTELGFGILGIFGNNLSGGQKNIGPFSNVQANTYWSGTENNASDPRYAWDFNNSDGYQYSNSKFYQFYAWAVSPGQVSAVPIPGAVWLFGSAITGLIGFNRRKPMQQAV